MLDRLATYINLSEQGHCAEYHFGDWPRCEESGHAEGLALLSDLGRDAANVWSEDRVA